MGRRIILQRENKKNLTFHERQRRIASWQRFDLIESCLLDVVVVVSVQL